ncbi:MAG: histidinol-phosphatase [Treponema sp.]|nr:histidinol-phosphatase [Treponema sp.]
MEKCNFHTHTNFCDGKNTAEEMVLSAIEKNFNALGFSSHSMFPFSGNWHIPSHDFISYTDEIKRLKEKYSDKIKIFTGFECDYYPTLTFPDKEFYKELSPDYLIGSVHYIANKKGHYSVDNSSERVKRGLNILYNGNGKKAVQEYFAAEREMIEKGNFDILGHPDLIKIRNGELNFFNPNDSWYKKELKTLAKTAAKKGVIAEINTGGLARNSIKDFYPSQELMEYFFEYKVPVCINSDAHKTEHLDFAFNEAKEMAKKIGYKELVYPCVGAVKI